MKRTTLFAYLIYLSLSPLMAQSGEADEILGVWLTGSKKGKVEIYKCGNKYCGKIVWLKDPFYEDGSPKRDKNNPDSKMHQREIIGTVILSGFVYDEEYEWEDGDIYDPDNGKTYSCLMSLQKDKKTLEVRGYVGFSWIGRTEYWTKSTLEK